jgi:hypothetical protein
MEDLAHLVEGMKFVGSEFLVWLWFESELFEGSLQLIDGTQCEFWFESQLLLVRDKEQASLKGEAPSANPEAHEALRQGKLPSRARVRLIRNELEYGFVLSADDLSLSSVKIPAQLKKEKDEQFYERMYLIEELETMLEGLFADFLVLRLGKAWDAFVLPNMRTWVKDEAADIDGYTRKLAESITRKRK